MNNNIVDQLSECDKEQIKYIDAIQSMGSLFAIDSNGIIAYAAIAPQLPIIPREVLGKHTSVVLGDDTTRVIEAIEEREEPTTPILIKSRIFATWLTCIGHQIGDFKVLELELSPPREVNIPPVKFMNERHDSLDTYLSFIVENIQMVTGYDRVMIYRFASDWHGEVVAESLAKDSHSFYGHHFPASDIPAPARDLFTRVWIRMIADVDSISIPIACIDNGAKLDLTKSILRASSPIHLEYLRNMGVKASLTMSIICDGQLWGLIACHNFSAKYLVAEERSVCSLLAKLISSRITSMTVNQAVAATKRIADFTSAVATQLTNSQILETVRDHKHSLLRLVPSDGFCFVTKKSTVSDGSAPSSLEARTIAKMLDSFGLDLVHIDSLAKSFPDLAPMSFSGVLAVKVANDWCLWTRKEHVRSILWAGDPNKAAYADDKANRLSPRLSFDAWSETVVGTSIPWQQAELDAADKLRQTILRALGQSSSRPSDYRGFEKSLQAEIKREVADLSRNFKDLDLGGF